MNTATNSPLSFNALEHISIDQEIEKHAHAIESGDAASLDQFYLEMLDQLLPANQKARYIQRLEKQIQAIFRVDQVICTVLYEDSTIESFSMETNVLLSSLNGGPLSVGRISYLLHSEYADRVSVEYFTKEAPTFEDLRRGYLYTNADLEAGFMADLSEMDELMCEWLQNYQQWLQDYLHFNLAQISKDSSDLPKRTLPLLQNHQEYAQAKTGALL